MSALGYDANWFDDGKNCRLNVLPALGEEAFRPEKAFAFSD